MKKTHFAAIDKELSNLGFGAAGISGDAGGYAFGNVSEKDAIALIHAALERDINLFDTAPIYGFGASEERLGKALKGNDRAFIVTKGGVDWHNSKRVNMSNDPKVIERMLHESLKRLQREQIDLYMIHWPDQNVDIRRPLEVLAKAQAQGKIKHIGLCNTNQEDLEKSSEVCTIDAFQSQHNLWETTGYDLVENKLDRALFMGWGTLDKGILSGRVTKDRKYDDSDARSWAPWWNKKEVQQKIDVVEKFSQTLKAHKLSMKDFAITAARTQSHPVIPLVGVKTIADLDNMIELFSRECDKNLVQDLAKEFKDLYLSQIS